MDAKQILVKLGRKIRKLRVEMGYELVEFAKRSGLSVVRLKRIEKGQINIRYVTLVRIANAFEISMAQFINTNKR